MRQMKLLSHKVRKFRRRDFFNFTLVTKYYLNYGPSENSGLHVLEHTSALAGFLSMGFALKFFHERNTLLFGKRLKTDKIKVNIYSVIMIIQIIIIRIFKIFIFWKSLLVYFGGALSLIFAMAFAQYKANWLVPVGAVTYALVWELSNKKI